MYPFQAIYPARTVEEALALFQKHPGAKWIAGGSDLLIQLRNGTYNNAELISIYQIDALRGIHLEADGTLRILPLTCFADMAASELLHSTAGVLAQAAGTVGGPQIRNIGTIGGNLCNGATSADTAATLLAYDAKLEITGPQKTRYLSLRDFYTGLKKVDLHPGELLTAIRISKEAYQGFWGEYLKFSTRNAMDIATLGCSVLVKLTPNRQQLAALRLAFGVAAPVPIRAYEAEAAFKGHLLCQNLPEEIGAYVQSQITPRSSWRASAAYRLALSSELTQRAVRHSIELAGGIYVG